MYLFPDGRRWKRECPGCVGSLIMLAAFPEAAGSVDGVSGWEAGLCDGTGLRSRSFVVPCGLGQSRSHTKL